MLSLSRLPLIGNGCNGRQKGAIKELSDTVEGQKSCINEQISIIFDIKFGAIKKTE